jgi:hypothetical protein
MAKSKGTGKAVAPKVPAKPGTAPYQMTNPGVKGYGSAPKKAGR